MKSFFQNNLDRLGICASAFCAVHCLLTPIILFLIPVAGLATLESEGVEITLIIISIFFVVISLVPSYLKQHKNLSPLLFAAIGYVFFYLGSLVHTESIEIGFSVFGGILIVTAHLRNRYFSKKSIA